MILTIKKTLSKKYYINITLRYFFNQASEVRLPLLLKRKESSKLRLHGQMG